MKDNESRTFEALFMVLLDIRDLLIDKEMVTMPPDKSLEKSSTGSYVRGVQDL